MRELSKSIVRRMNNSNFVRKYFKGDGIDIGGLPDPLILYQEFFPLMNSVRIWDLEDGDAQYMKGVPDNSVDFIHSSHCLEHLNDPFEGLSNWLRVIKPNGYIIVTIPDEDLYEQGVFPSTFNLDHKNTFTIYKEKSWSPNSINVVSLIQNLGSQVQTEKIELLSSTYRFELPRFDQTSTPVGESAIEFILRKTTVEEASMGNRIRKQEQPRPQLRKYYNQYRNDYKNMKKVNTGEPPFSDEGNL